MVGVQKSARPERMCDNIDIFDFEDTDDEMTRIAAMDRGNAAMVSQLGNRCIE